MTRISKNIQLSIAALLVLTATLPAPARGVDAAIEDLIERMAAEGASRDRIAVAALRQLAGANFVPPACVANNEMFSDVPATNPFCPWIEELARRGVTSGCTETEYCPGDQVSRAQMAAFLVRAVEVCPTLDPTDEMIRIGGECVDKYEASLWDAPTGGNQITGPIPCSADGQDCHGVIFARSVAGVVPRSDISWFQAQVALANSGKRLPTNAEWQIAALGTPDDTFPCNMNSGALSATGAHTLCVSSWGTFDMVGNVWELTADWKTPPTNCSVWPAFSDDVTCMLGASTSGSPNAIIRGGDFAANTNSGPFAIHSFIPYATDQDVPPGPLVAAIGFRGAR